MRALTRVLRCLVFVQIISIAVPLDVAARTRTQWVRLSDGTCAREEVDDGVNELLLQMREIADRSAAEGAARSAGLRTLLETKVPALTVVATWTREFKGPRAFAEPSALRIKTFILWQPTTSVDAASPSLGWLWSYELRNYAIAKEQYRLFKKGMSAYNVGLEDLGEGIGGFLADHAPLPPLGANLAGAIVATDIEFVGGALALGPNLILMPEALVESPAHFKHACKEMFLGGYEHDFSRWARGTAEYAGTVATIAGAIALADGIARLAPADVAAKAERPGAGMLSHAEGVDQPRPGLQVVREGERLVIGRVSDLDGQLPFRGEGRLDLPDQGSPKANWKQNAGELREAIRRGEPIRDASVEPDGTLIEARYPDGSLKRTFLSMERNLLRERGWVYDPQRQQWAPEGYKWVDP